MWSLNNTSTGSNNTALGSQAGYGVDGNSFSNNSLFGHRAGYTLSTGSNNIFLGYKAAESTTIGTKNIVLGYDIDTPAPTSTNTLNI